MRTTETGIVCTVAELRAVLAFASTDSTREHLHALCLERARVLASDGHTACLLMPCAQPTNAPDAPERWVVGVPAVKMLVSGRSAGTEITLTYGDAAIVAESPAGRLDLPRLDVQFPPVMQCVPSHVASDGPCATYGIDARYLARLAIMSKALGGKTVWRVRTPDDGSAPIRYDASSPTACATVIIMPARIDA